MNIHTAISKISGLLDKSREEFNKGHQALAEKATEKESALSKELDIIKGVDGYDARLSEARQQVESVKESFKALKTEREGIPSEAAAAIQNSILRRDLGAQPNFSDVISAHITRVIFSEAIERHQDQIINEFSKLTVGVRQAERERYFEEHSQVLQKYGLVP